MKPTLEALWNGTIHPSQTSGTKDKEIYELMALANRNREALSKTLDDQQMPLLEKYLDCIEEYTYLSSMYAFSDGFCLAAKLMTEALC